MDETAICMFQGGGRGNVFLAKGSERVQNVPRNKRRTYMTHVAFVCDDPLVQPLLPHIVIGNERTIPARSLGALRAACPANVRLLRLPSAWVNGKICAQIIRWLAVALAPVLGNRQPILLFDACRSHLCHCVFNACAAAHIWPIVVPAKMTWLLQPLDTHAFLPYKIRLQQLYGSARVRASAGDVGVQELLQCIYAAIREVLQGRRWESSFERDGFGAAQAGVSERVTEQLGIASPIDVPTTRPVLAQLKACFPARTRVSEEHVWRAVSGDIQGMCVSVGPRLHRIAFSGRTRAQSQLVAIPAGAASSSASGSSGMTAATPAAVVAAFASSSSATVAEDGPIALRTRARTRAARVAELP